MADFINLQINGVHVIMYSMVGLTTAVLAYATAGGAIGNFATNAIGAVSPTDLLNGATGSMASLGALNPFESKSAETEKSTPDAQEPTSDTQEPTVAEQEPPAASEENKEPEISSLNVETEEEEQSATGGKRRRNKKTPKRSRSRKNGKSKKKSKK